MEEPYKRRLDVKNGLNTYQLSDYGDCSKRYESCRDLKFMEINDLEDMLFGDEFHK